MRLTKDPGMLLLAIWLLAWGLFKLGVVNFGGSGTLLSLLAMAAGVVLAIRR